MTTKAKTAKPRSIVTSAATELLEFAKQEAKRAKSWEQLHNAIYGIGGRSMQLFPDQSSRTAFAKTAEYKAIAELIGSLGSDDDLPDAASGRFVLRLPESMHAALVSEAKMEGVSLNQLCVAKLATQLRAIVR